jgi:hypothetical protein
MTYFTPGRGLISSGRSILRPPDKEFKSSMLPAALIAHQAFPEDSIGEACEIESALRVCLA